MELGGPFPNPVILAPLGTTFRAGLSQNCQLHATEEALSLLKGYLQACLNLQEQYLEAHDRLLAETHYQLGLAYGYNSQYDEAVAQFSKSIP